MLAFCCCKKFHGLFLEHARTHTHHVSNESFEYLRNTHEDFLSFCSLLSVFFYSNKMFHLITVLWIIANFHMENCQAVVGERRRPTTSRSEGLLLGHYLVLPQTAYLSHTPAFQTFSTSNELECKCLCSSNKQCLAVAHRLSNSMCSLYGNDPCDTRLWQSNIDVNFFIHITRLKYRVFEKPQRNLPLQRASNASLCGSTSDLGSEKRWFFAMKINGQSKENFHGLNFNQAPNQVAPSPWYNTPIENIWNSILLHQW